MATFVLVHGSWAGAWIWKKVIPLLRAAGHEVYATTATGMGDRVHLADPKIDLDTLITDVVNVLEFDDLTEVTLVGWSSGGTFITGVAERVPERLAQLDDQPLALWSVGCSSGEEAYSLAISAAEALRANSDDAPFGVTATDISLSALNKARAGVYGSRRLEALEPELRRRYFEVQADERFKVVPSLAARLCCAPSGTPTRGTRRSRRPSWSCWTSPRARWSARRPSRC